MVALPTIHLKPGDWYPEAYNNLPEEERELLTKAFDVIDKITIKDGENVKSIKIH